MKIKQQSKQLIIHHLVDVLQFCSVAPQPFSMCLTSRCISSLCLVLTLLLCVKNNLRASFMPHIISGCGYRRLLLQTLPSVGVQCAWPPVLSHFENVNFSLCMQETYLYFRLIAGFPYSIMIASRQMQQFSLEAGVIGVEILGEVSFFCIFFFCLTLSSGSPSCSWSLDCCD